MKAVIFLSASFVSNLLFAQTDSLNKKVLKFSGASFELGSLLTPYNGGDLDNYKSQFSNDPLLAQDYSNQTYNRWYSFPQGYNNYFSLCAKSFFTITKKSRVSKEIFIGLRYQKAIHSAFGYNKSSSGIIQNYINTTTQDTVFRVIEDEQNSSFGVVGRQLFLPIGFNINTKKERRFWLTAGICLAPGLNVNTSYQSTSYLTKYNYLTEQVDENNTFEKYSKASQTTLSSYEQKISPSFAFYSSVPLTINVRMSKKTKILKNTNLFVCTEPVYYYSKTKKLNANNGFTWANSVGIRANW